MQRLCYWALSVEELKIPPSSPGCLLGPTALRILISGRNVKLFANIRSLELNDITMLSISTNLIGPKLERLVVDIPPLTCQEHVTLCRTAMEDLLGALANMSLQLTTLSVSIVHARWYQGRTLLSLVDVPGYERLVQNTAKTMRDFASSIPVTTLAAASLLRNVLDKCRIDLSRADLAILNNFLDPFPEEKMPWSRMIDMSITFYDLTDEAISLLEKLKAPRLQALHLSTYVLPASTGPRILQTMKTLTNLCSPDSLTSLQVVLPLWNTESSSIKGQSDIPILDAAALKPLLCFKNLLCLCIFSRDLAIDNHLVATMALAFPRLQKLYLFNHRAWNMPPTATWKALALLNARCQHLVELGLTIDARKHRLRYERGATNPRLRTWHVGTSPLPPPTAAKTLMDLGRAMHDKNPKLQHINFCGMDVTFNDRSLLQSLPEALRGRGRSWKEVADYKLILSLCLQHERTLTSGGR